MEGALLNFETLSQAELEYFDHCPKIINYNGKIAEINCDGWEVTYGCKYSFILKVFPLVN